MFSVNKKKVTPGHGFAAVICYRYRLPAAKDSARQTTT